MARLVALGTIRPEERVVAGRAGGAVWVIGSITVFLLAVILPEAAEHRSALLALAGAALLWGLVSMLLVDHRRTPWWLCHVSAVAGVGGIAAAIALTGGGLSPAWASLFYVVVFAAYFFEPPVAAAYFAACVAIQCIAVLGSSDRDHGQALAAVVVSVPAFVVLGGAIVVGKRYLWSLRLCAEHLAAEQGALRRVATAVVSGESSERFYAMVAIEAGHLVGASGAVILRLDSPEATIALGTWAVDPARTYRQGTAIRVRPDGAVARALAADEPVRTDEESADSATGQLGFGSSIVVPIRASGKLWGVLVVATDDTNGFTGEHVRRLKEFGDLISAAITSIEDRAALATQATTDALTGLANTRAFRARLAADLARARRHGSPMSIAMIDVDRFKLVNDLGGHDAGDDMLIRVARCLRSAARTEDTLARVGGDEFAWILPESTSQEALLAVERAREAVSAGGEAMTRTTISAGICDTSCTEDPTELVRMADRALYASKERGRNQVRVYDAGAAGELAAR